MSNQLRRLPAQSSPGPDGVPYYVWKSGKSSPELLAQIYSVCCTNQQIPSSWKTSTTILIHKKGDESLPSNWRPISLQPTIYKVYAAILARRLASWALQNKKISSSQKVSFHLKGAPSTPSCSEAPSRIARGGTKRSEWSG